MPRHITEAAAHATRAVDRFRQRGYSGHVAALGQGLDKMARSGSSEQAFRRVEVLELIGSNAAIGWLDHWSRKARSRVRDLSQSALAGLARGRGVSGDDLADLVFGDFGCDDRGHRSFSVCGRSVLARFDSTGEVGVVKDERGLAARFPGMLTGDDEVEYERVRDEYRAWRKALKRALTGQIERLEWAMIWGRSWDLETFMHQPLALSDVPRCLLAEVATEVAGPE